MNNTEYYLSRIFLTIFGWFFGLFPLDQRKVVFASARDNKPSGNLLALSDAYKKAYPDAHYVMLFRTYSYGFAGKISYLFSLIRTTYHLKTARYFFVDNALFPVHVIKHRPQTTVIQVWHATGALKKFGLDTDVEERKVENRFLHKGYDYVIADSEQTRNAYTSAFHIPLQHVLGLGSPRTDALLAPDAKAKARAKLYARYPQLEDKTIMLFVPTFRGFSAKKTAAHTLDTQRLKETLGPQYGLVYKPHAVVKAQDAAGFDVILDEHEDINTYLPACDLLITDYSSVLFEAALLNKPVFRLCGDFDEYRAVNGFYLDYFNDIPGPACKTTDELANAIENLSIPPTLSAEENAQWSAFTERLCTYSDGRACERILERFAL